MSESLIQSARIRRQRKQEQLKIVGQFTKLEEVKRVIETGLGFGPVPIHVVLQMVGGRGSLATSALHGSFFNRCLSREKAQCQVHPRPIHLS